MFESILLLVLMVVAFYFLLIRPQQRKQREHQSMMSKLEPGARIMTNAGVFGTIVHMGDKQAIIEVAPGVEMTVLKQAIMRTVTPAEEEFEYDDSGAVETDDVDVEADLVTDGEDVVVDEVVVSDEAEDEATPGSDSKN